MSHACKGQTKQLEYKDFLTWWVFSTSFYHRNATGCRLHHVKKKFNKYLKNMLWSCHLNGRFHNYKWTGP